MTSQELMSKGWVPGFPNYNGAWSGFEIAYFNGVAWHRGNLPAMEESTK